MRILIAEDERSLNEIIAKKLTSDGYSVDACFDGEGRFPFFPIRTTMRSFWIL